jgi:hypothetical protein
MKTTFSRLSAPTLAVAYWLALSEGALVQAAPTVTTLPASSMLAVSTNMGSTLNGTVNPNGAATSAWFEWGLTIRQGTHTSMNQSLFKIYETRRVMACAILLGGETITRPMSLAGFCHAARSAVLGCF